MYLDTLRMKDSLARMKDSLARISYVLRLHALAGVGEMVWMNVRVGGQNRVTFQMYQGKAASGLGSFSLTAEYGGKWTDGTIVAMASLSWLHSIQVWMKSSGWVVVAHTFPHPPTPPTGTNDDIEFLVPHLKLDNRYELWLCPYQYEVWTVEEVNA